MLVLYYIALGYLIITTAILLRNTADFKPLYPVPSNYFVRQAPGVSICIPARDEEASVERCVRSAAGQDYPDFHIYVLNDESTDGTSAILDRLEEQLPDTLTVIAGRPKPDDWLGKPWACHQLAEASHEDILLFIDADTWLEPSAVSKTVRTMGKDILDFITLWPDQKLGSFWEKTVIPLIYMALLTMLPVRYVRRPPQWIPPFLRSSVSPFFAAACGQYMAFKRRSYEQVGGHQSVKGNIVDDVALAKNIKYAGYSMNMYHGSETVGCRMYRSAGELWEGLRKNFLAGFAHNIFLFLFMGMLHAIAFLVPVISLALFLAVHNTLLLPGLAAVLLMLFQRITINRWFNWNTLFALFHPVGVAWFQALGLQVLKDYFSGRSPVWKRRRL